MGILIKGPEILESTRRVDTIVLDKTGTVTTGAMSLVAVSPATNIDPDDLLRYAGALESGSEHPIAKAITAAALDRFGSIEPVTEFSNRPGLGVSGVVGGRPLHIGRPTTDTSPGPGETLVELQADDGTVLGHLAVSDTVKPTSAAAVQRFRQLGLEPVLLTGDNGRPPNRSRPRWVSPACRPR